MNSVCGEGYLGRMCGQCSWGFFKKGGFCKSCGKNQTTSPMTQSGSIMLVSFLSAVILLFSAYSLRNAETGFIFIFPFYLQVIGVMSSLRLNWPSKVIDYLGVFSLFNLNIETVGPECMGLTSAEFVFEFSYYIVLMTPIWVLIISGFILFLYSIWHTSNQWRLQRADLDVKEMQKELEDAFISSLPAGSSPVSSSQSFEDIRKIGSITKSSSPVNTSGAFPKKKKKKTDDRTYGCDKGFFDSMCTSALVVFDFMYFPIAFQSFAFLNCSFRPKLGFSIYGFAADRVCYESWWTGQSQLSIASIFIYLGGITLFMWGSQQYRARILRAKHSEFSKTEEFVLRFTHYRKPPFRTNFGYWNTVLLAKKLVVAIVFATLSHYPMIQILLLVAIMVTSLASDVKFEPFHLKEANTVEKVVNNLTLGWYFGFCCYFFARCCKLPRLFRH
jgi:Transient receptor potential (TRP) ion channel